MSDNFASRLDRVKQQFGSPPRYYLFQSKDETIEQAIAHQAASMGVPPFDVQARHVVIVTCAWKWREGRPMNSPGQTEATRGSTSPRTGPALTV